MGRLNRPCCLGVYSVGLFRGGHCTHFSLAIVIDHWCLLSHQITARPQCVSVTSDVGSENGLAHRFNVSLNEPIKVTKIETCSRLTCPLRLWRRLEKTLFADQWITITIQCDTAGISTTDFYCCDFTHAEKQTRYAAPLP